VKKTGSEMSAEIRDDGYVKNPKTGRWLKPGGKAYKDYMASIGHAEPVAVSVPAPAAAEPAEPKPKAKPRVKKAAPPPEPDSEPEADELAPDLSDCEGNIEMPHLTEADFLGGLEAVRSGLSKCDSFQAVAPEPPAPKVRKPRKPRVKKAA